MQKAPKTNSGHCIYQQLRPARAPGGAGSHGRGGGEAVLSGPGQRSQAGGTPPRGLRCHTGVRKMSEGADRAPRHTHGTLPPASRTEPPLLPPLLHTTLPSGSSSMRRGGGALTPRVERKTAAPTHPSFTSSGRPAPPLALPGPVNVQ